MRRTDSYHIRWENEKCKEYLYVYLYEEEERGMLRQIIKPNLTNI